jgi:hypothetical protein
MSNTVRALAATALAASIVSSAGGAIAMPVAGGLAITTAAPAMVETVRWGWGWGWGGVGAGFVAGAILGGALVGPHYYYGPGPYYYGAPYYPAPYYPAPGYSGAPAAGDPVAYCMARFKSYDPNSGTYLGYDGNRHPCP